MKFWFLSKISFCLAVLRDWWSVALLWPGKIFKSLLGQTYPRKGAQPPSQYSPKTVVPPKFEQFLLNSPFKTVPNIILCIIINSINIFTIPKSKPFSRHFLNLAPVTWSQCFSPKFGRKSGLFSPFGFARPTFPKSRRTIKA